MITKEEIDEFKKSFDSLSPEEVQKLKRSWVVLRLRMAHPDLERPEAEHYYDLYNNDSTI